jgi:hypothetical protein
LREFAVVPDSVIEGIVLVQWNAHDTSIALTDPAVSVSDMRAWLDGREFIAALPPAREAELIANLRNYQSQSR